VNYTSKCVKSVSKVENSDNFKLILNEFKSVLNDFFFNFDVVSILLKVLLNLQPKLYVPLKYLFCSVNFEEYHAKKFFT
jgi:hypothetical protein